ncbi:uncharacterized protein CANTADRAFT_52225 [Suhomyces tanzawaensis NRRL Y-17324]|uniref:t-SNARE coiled-coil homology domain-containing protein n=1 Tax=Suhomyces tanzawaensis NRRL Y-17324 TaxID=984487 RepID=A0A1E4SIU6_9ASCO|nr:uncharacterized protein CANTADRAFT_52225 [Suhomyces tanzawaensis NRRL Y-17324]ODV79429.1 hypothetical protein CANTADRAFT_52225 [Suhomyces tanzawaensis NRRL Y-17324]
MPSTKDVRKALTKVTINLDSLQSSLEERDRLVQTLKLTPSPDDNYDLINIIQKVLKALNYIQDDLVYLINQGEVVDELIESFKEVSSRYDQYINELTHDAYITVEEYEFIRKDLPKEESKKPKTVRFRDDVTEDNEELRTELMGTRAFKPYSDDEPQTDAESFDHETNQQLFAKHQQTLLDQDQDLDILHESIKRQHSMGRTINTELDDHLILLNDLELGVDVSQQRLNSATHKLLVFRTRVAENGSLVTIVVLTIIVIVLLVTLN